MNTGILDHNVNKKVESINLSHGKGRGDITSNDSYTGMQAHIVKKKKYTKIERNFYSVLASGAVVMGISSSTIPL